MSVLYGYAGKLLRVDLTTGKITEEHLSEETARKYLGGNGIGAKYLFDEVPSGVEWSDARNRLIFASGPLGATAVGGSGTVAVVTKGSLTNGAVASQANGFFGAFLKLSGYDGIILQGRSSGWRYLYVRNGKAELRDASHLENKDTWETADLIKNELSRGQRQVSVACIGPAGENLVKFACVVVDKAHVAAHGGVGAVMGSKRLKAIAVERGKESLALKDKAGFSAIAREFHDRVANDPLDAHYKWGTLSTLYNMTVAGNGIIPVRNYTTTLYDIEPEKLAQFQATYIRSRFEPKPDPCWACRMHHCHTMTITQEPFKGQAAEEPEYEILAAMGPVIGVTDVSAAIFLGNELDRMGMDGNEAGWTLGLAMECREKGLLGTKDTDGLDLTWGNYEASLQMIRRIARREGFGDVLADGAMRAARRIGGEAPNFAIHTMKGNTPRGHDHRSRWPQLFDTCVSQVGTDEGYGMSHPEDLGLATRPRRGGNNISPEDTLAWNVQGKGAAHFEDCLGVCSFVTRTEMKLLSQAISAATGWDFSAKEAMDAGRRVVNLLRVFNIRHGHTAEMDAPSPRYGSAPADGPTKGKTIMPYWSELRSQYYELMGWDRETGRPLPETLKALGLDHAIHS